MRRRTLAAAAVIGASAWLAACGTAPGAPVPEPDARGAWRILQARSAPMVDTARTRLDLNADGTLTGHTSCNTMRGRYTLEGQTLSIGPVATTRIGCGGLYLEQEDRILGALEVATVARVRPEDGLLELRDAGGRTVLRAMRWKD